MARGNLELQFTRWREQGDVAALAQVFDAVALELQSLARHLTHDTAAAEDLVQATFVAAIENAARFDAHRELTPWLVGILNNKAKLALALRARSIDPSRFEERVVADPALDAEMREFVAALARALQRVPVRYREVLERHLMRGERAEVIAAALKRESGTVRVQLHRGLALLRRALPSSFAVGLSLSSMRPRGMSAVRAEVLTCGQTTLIASTTAPLVIGATFVSSKILWGFVAVAAALAAFLVSRSGDAARPDEAGGRAALESELNARDATATSTSRGSDTRVAVAPTIDATDENHSNATVGELVFVVTWHDGTPAGDIGLELASIGPNDAHALAVDRRTGVDGRASISALHPGDYELFVDRISASYREPFTRVRVVAGRTQTVTVPLSRGYDFEGIVLDLQRNPVAGATIWGSNWTSTGVALGTSRSDGTFEVRSLRGDADLMAMADGLGASEPFEFRGKHPRTAWDKFLARFQSEERVFTGIELVLDGSSAKIEGMVRDESGAPVEDARIAWMKPNVKRGTRFFRQALFVVSSDSDGHFELGGLRPGYGELLVWAPGHARFRQYEELVDRRATHFDVSLGRGVTVTGLVVDAAGSPIGGVSIEEADGATRSVWSEFHASQTRSAADGAFRLEYIEPGEFRLAAHRGEHGARDTVERQFEAEHGDEVRWDIAFDNGHSIAGIAVDLQARPLAGWTVRARPASDPDGTPVAQVQSSRDGTFEIQRLARGDYHLQLVSTSDGAIVGERNAVSAGRRDVRLEGDLTQLPSVYITGRVVDSRGAAVVAKINAFAHRMGPDGVTTDSKGAFKIGPLQPGEIEVWIEPTGLERIELIETNVAANETRSLGRVTVPDTARLDVVLRRADGGELDAPKARLEAPSGGWTPLYDDGTGVLTSGATYVGTFELVLEARNGLERRVQVELKANENQRVEYALAPASRRRVTIQTLDGEPLGRLHMVVRDASGVQLLEQRWRGPKSRTSQRLVLPPGRLTIEVTTSEGRSAVLEVQHSDAHSESDEIVLDVR